MKLDFDKMCFIEKVYWKIRLWLMDHKIPLIITHPSILEPSYYYTHTDDECREEMQRRKDELLHMIDELSKNNKPVTE